MVNWLFYAGNLSLLKATHDQEFRGGYSPQEAADAMAAALGPSPPECRTTTPGTGEAYPTSVYSHQSTIFTPKVSYYRDGAISSRWEKSLETIAGLYSLSHENEFRRTSSGAGLFDEGPKGFLRASSTIVWGERDFALGMKLCVDGIADYLVNNSQVVLLPRTGHFTPIERNSRLIMSKLAIWAARGEKEDIESVVEESYPGAVVSVRR